GFATMSDRRNSLNVAAVSGDTTREQRSHAGRARARLHNFSERRLASNCAAHFGTHRRKGRHGLARATREQQPAKCYQARDSLRGALMLGGSARDRNGKGGALTIWPQKISGCGKNR